MLAAAVDLARREGLPLPIPVTLRFPHASSRESEWQELLISWLGLEDWVRLELDEELDFTGPIAARGLSRHGVLFPPNVHLIAPVAERAGPGGAVLTGVGGDAALGYWQWASLADALARRRRPHIRDVRAAIHAAAPLALRREILARRNPWLLPWLHEPVRRAVARVSADDRAREPRSWSARTLAWSRSRAWRATVRNLEVLGADAGVSVGSPLLDPRFLGAVARAGGRLGWGDRTESVRAVCGGLLPVEVIERRGKATFGGVFFAAPTREFARNWDGRTGVDPDLVDSEILRRVWQLPAPHFGSGMLLQSIWLASQNV